MEPLEYRTWAETYKWIAGGESVAGHWLNSMYSPGFAWGVATQLIIATVGWSALEVWCQFPHYDGPNNKTEASLEVPACGERGLYNGRPARVGSMFPALAGELQEIIEPAGPHPFGGGDPASALGGVDVGAFTDPDKFVKLLTSVGGPLLDKVITMGVPYLGRLFGKLWEIAMIGPLGRAEEPEQKISAATYGVRAINFAKSPLAFTSQAGTFNPTFGRAGF